jgi:hypothetical protein
MPSAPFVELCQTARDIGTLNSDSSLLNWDQETYMPPAAADHRAEQASMLASLVHERRTHKHVGDLIATCETDKSIVADPSSAAAAAVREFRRDFELATKLPAILSRNSPGRQPGTGGLEGRPPEIRLQALRALAREDDRARAQEGRLLRCRQGWRAIRRSAQ